MTEDLLSEAAKLLEQGNADFTLQSLAATLGLSTTAIYRYFASKDEVIVGLQKRALLDLGQRLSRALEVTDEPLVRLAAVGWTFVAWKKEAPGYFRLLALSLAETHIKVDDAAAASVAIATATIFEMIDGAAQDAADEKLLAAKPKDFASTLWAVLHGLLLIQKFARLPALSHLQDDTAIADAMSRLFLAYGAEPQAAKAAVRRAKVLIVVGSASGFAHSSTEAR